MRFQKVRSALAAAGKIIVDLLSVREVMLLSGVVLVGYGVGQVNLPAGFIVSGAMLFGVAVFGVRNQAPEKVKDIK